MNTDIIETRRLVLRPPLESDYPTFFSWRNSKRTMRLFSDRRSPASYEQFLSEIKRDLAKRHKWLVAELRANSALAGMIFSFSYSQVDGHAFVNTFLDEQYERRGYGAEMFCSFVSYLFEFYQLRKIYCEVFAYNTLSLSSITNLGAMEEGRFRKHRYYDGDYHDVIRLAIYRDLLAEKIRRLANRYAYHPKSS